MVKFTMTIGDGRTLIGLGLEAENIRRLQAGQPIRVALSDLGFTGAVGTFDVVIFSGKDGASMRRELASLIGPNTVVHDTSPELP